MKTKSILSTLMVILIYNEVLIAQTPLPFHDAIYLKLEYEKSLLPAKKILITNNVRQLLSPYFPAIDPNNIDKVFLDNNPFFKDMFINSVATSAGTPFKNILSNVGNLDVTNFADGLSKFLVKRTKQELNVAFFNQFLDDLDKKPELRILFPSTYSVLKTIENEIYHYAAFTQALREAFEKDISNLFINIPNLPDLNSTIMADELSVLKAGSQIAQNIDMGIHPAEALKILASGRIFTTETQNSANFTNAAKLVSLFSNSFRSKNPSRYWIPADSLELLLNDPIAFKIYMGLIFQQNKNFAIQFNNGVRSISFEQILIELAPNIVDYEQYKSFIRGLLSKGQVIDNYYLQIKNKAPQERNYNDYYQLYSSSYNLLKYVALIKTQIPNFPIDPNTKEVQKFFYVTGLVGDVYLETNQKKYSSAVMDASALLTTLLGDKFNPWKGQFIKYGSFISAVAIAENSDEVEAAIETVALPAGSASVKKASPFSISLNSYVGAFYGTEYLADKQNNKWGQVFGITAPVGIGFNWGLSNKCNKKCKQSISLFASVIDIGAVVSYRFQDNSTQALPNFTFQNILAPGLNIIYGLPNWPVSIGGGYQLGPVLREISATEKNIGEHMNGRWQIFIAVDIPIIHFYTKPKFN